MSVVCLVWSLLISCMWAENSKEDFTLYNEVVQKLKEESIFPVDEKKLMEGCLNGVINAVDKDGSYYNEHEYEQLFSTSTLSARLGFHMVQREGHFIIKSVIPNSPAFKAGLQSGDEILKVDTTSLRHLDRDSVIAILRGYPNTKVKLSILKAGSARAVDVTMARKVIDENKLVSKLIDNRFIYTKIIKFEVKAPYNLLADIEQLAQEPKEGIILDLRDNLGGVLSSGLGVASLFLPPDSVLINVKSRQKEDKKQYKNRASDFEDAHFLEIAKAHKFLRTTPLVILVNQDSMGSAEIVSAILQEYNRATIIGQPTFGKDTFAGIFPLSNQTTAMKLATARWTTAKGKSVWPNGVIPNIEVEQENENEDPALEMALTILDKKQN